MGEDCEEVSFGYLLDLNFLGSIDECIADCKDLEKAIDTLNLFSMERDRLWNPEMPVPAEPDLSDEIRANVDWYKA